ncbi:unnamed protein product [Porites lobata]|uniref:Uncharacterized protein n=1 Tax=Porites lobata TaxID=104759 RepID=A0ABN8NC23_9CNID|nr:unnamed protein product [Porites lobata]
MKGVRKQLQEAKAEFQSVYKELKEQRINDQIGEDETVFLRTANCSCKIVHIDCGKVELLLNAKKTKAEYFNIEKEEVKTVDDTKIKQVVVEETGEQDSNTWETGYVLRKET